MPPQNNNKWTENVKITGKVWKEAYNLHMIGNNATYKTFLRIYSLHISLVKEIRTLKIFHSPSLKVSSILYITLNSA